jgi:hypothetical protein
MLFWGPLLLHCDLISTQTSIFLWRLVLTLFLRRKLKVIKIIKLCWSCCKVYFQKWNWSSDLKNFIVCLTPTPHNRNGKAKETMGWEICGVHSFPLLWTGFLTTTVYTTGFVHCLPGQQRKCRYYKPCDNLQKKSNLPRLLHFCLAFSGNKHYRV